MPSAGPQTPRWADAPASRTLRKREAFVVRRHIAALTGRQSFQTREGLGQRRVPAGMRCRWSPSAAAAAKVGEDGRARQLPPRSNIISMPDRSMRGATNHARANVVASLRFANHGTRESIWIRIRAIGQKSFRIPLALGPGVGGRLLRQYYGIACLAVLASELSSTRSHERTFVNHPRNHLFLSASIPADLLTF